MPRCATLPTYVATLLGLILTHAPRATAQVPDIAPIPRGSEPGDVEEVDDVVDDAEVLPRGDDDPATQESEANVDAIERMHRDELSYSNDEIRSRYAGGLSVTLGSTRPWQTYSIDAFFLPRSEVAYGLYAGGGSVTQNGVAFEQTYDLTVQTRAFGVSGRYHFKRLKRISIEALLGYAAWNGRFTPHDGNEDEATIDPTKVSSSYRATGLAFGFDCVIDWVWESGVFLDWTPVGVRRSRVLQVDLSRGDASVTRHVTRDLERAAFYGITNVRVGYLF